MAGIRSEYGFQTAGYQIAYMEMTSNKIKYRLIARFGKEDVEFGVMRFEENQADKLTFLAHLTLKTQLSELEKAK